MFDYHQRKRPWLKFCLWIAVPLVVVFAMGMHWYQSFGGIEKAAYPIAPKMPAVVSGTLPEVLARVDAALSSNAPHVLNYLQPGLSETDLAQLERQYRVQLPEEIKIIYRWHNGSVQPTNGVHAEFIPTHRFLPLEEALQEHALMMPREATWFQRALFHAIIGYRQSWICLFSDGAGDGYWYDLKRKPEDGRIFYNFTEDASYVYFPSAKNLMAGIAKGYETKLFFVKTNSSPPELDENFDRANAFWSEFGASTAR